MSTSPAKSSAGHGIGFDGRTPASANTAISITSQQRNVISEIYQEAEVVSVELKITSKMGRVFFKVRNSPTIGNAKPMSTNIRVYPVIGETISVFKLFDDFYYIYPLNSMNYINNNSVSGMANTKTIVDNKATVQEYKSTQSSRMPNNVNDSESKVKIGDYIVDQKSGVPILQPFEGDVILQGRVGNCIRLGYNKLTNLPNIKMSLITKRYGVYSPIFETLDADSCLWMTTDETLNVPKVGIPIDSRNAPPAKFDGKQIILSSGRIVLSSKENEVIVFSNMGIYNTSKTNFGVDSGDSILMNSTNNSEITSKGGQIILRSAKETILQCPNIYLGDTKGAQHMVKGDTLYGILDKLLTAILSQTYNNGAGATAGPLNSQSFLDIKAQLALILSERNFTV